MIKNVKMGKTGPAILRPKTTTSTVGGSAQTNLTMSGSIARRLQAVLDELQYTGKGVQGGTKESKPQGVLAVLEKVEKNQTESLRLLTNLEAVVGLSVNNEDSDYFSQLADEPDARD